MLLLAGATACRHAEPKAEILPPATDATSVVDAAHDPGPVLPPPSTDQRVSQMDFWLRLAVPPSDNSEGPGAFEAWGRTATRAEYEKGLAIFLNGRTRTTGLEDEYRRQLSEDFLILRWAEDQGLSRQKDFRVASRLALRERLARLILDTAVGAEPVPERDVRALYDARKKKYSTPEEATVRMILVPSEEDAKAVMARLDAGENFGQVAASESRHESRSRFGELAPFSRGAYNPQFEDVAFSLAPGQTGKATTPAGTFIIQKIATKPARVVPYEEVSDELRAELEEQRFLQRRGQALKRFEADLKK